MFGSKKRAGTHGEHTAIVLDIESSSVGAALAHIAPGKAPILFAEQRETLATPRTLHGSGIAKQVERAAHNALARLALVAARLRGTEATAKRGEFTHASVFLSAPWGVPNLAAGKADFSPQMQTFLTQEIDAFAPDVPLSFYTGADAAAFGTSMHRGEGITLLALVRGEITELILMGEQGPLGYATLPVGSRSIYRTLQAHAGLTFAEMPAVLALANTQDSAYSEPLDATALHMLEHIVPAIEALAQRGTPSGIVVVAEKGVAEWFARMLEADLSLDALFTPGATVRTLGSQHITPHLGGHSPESDLHLGLGALFTQAKLVW